LHVLLRVMVIEPVNTVFYKTNPLERDLTNPWMSVKRIAKILYDPTPLPALPVDTDLEHENNVSYKRNPLDRDLTHPWTSVKGIVKAHLVSLDSDVQVGMEIHVVVSEKVARLVQEHSLTLLHVIELVEVRLDLPIILFMDIKLCFIVNTNITYGWYAYTFGLKAKLFFIGFCDGSFFDLEEKNNSLVIPINTPNKRLIDTKIYLLTFLEPSFVISIT